MDKIYNIEQAKEKMKKSAKYYEVRIKAWENVKRLYKKDGGEFAILGKNFSGAKITTKPWNADDKIIEVCFRDENGSWTTDYIGLYATQYNDEADTPEKVQNRINDLIEKYKSWYEKDKKGAEQIEKQIKAIIPLLDKINKTLDTAKQETNTHYTIQGYIAQYLNIL
jgi:hypothetical protein